MEMASYAICCAPVDTPIVCVSWRSLPKIGSMGPFRLLDEARSAYAQWAAVSDDDLPVLPPPRTIRALATPSNNLGQRVAAPKGNADPPDLVSRGGAGLGTSSSSSARPGDGKPPGGVEEHTVRGPNGQKVDTGDLLSLHVGTGQVGAKPILSPRKEASPRAPSVSPRAPGGNPHLKVDLSGLPKRGFSHQSSLSKGGFDDKGNIMPDGFGGQLRFRDNHTQSTLGSAFDSGEAEHVSTLGELGEKAKRCGICCIEILGLAADGNTHCSKAWSSVGWLDGRRLRAPDIEQESELPLSDHAIQFCSLGPDGQLLELALAICFASAADCSALTESATVEDKKALQRLRALAERLNLLGRGVVVSSESKATLSPAELVTAFLNASAQSGSRGASPTNRPPGYARKDSAQSVLSKASLLRHRSTSRVRFDATDSPKASPRTPDRELRSGFNRSQSDFSCSSFTDFNRKQAHAKKDTNTAAPAFLEFLIAVLKGGQEQRVGAVSPPSPLGNAAVGANGNDVVLDLKLDTDFGRSISAHPEDDNASALTYHSYCDAMVAGAGGDGEEKEMISAEVLKLGGTEGKQTMRIAFKSKCLRTQNEWQKQLLAQQRALLDVVTGRLQAAERTLKEDEEVVAELWRLSARADTGRAQGLCCVDQARDECESRR
eukprot:s4730_g4.t1